MMSRPNLIEFPHAGRARLGLSARAPLRPAIFMDLRSLLADDLSASGSMQLAAGAVDALSLLAGLDYRLIVVGNASPHTDGVFRTQLQTAFDQCGAVFGGCYLCPHGPDVSPSQRPCLCRRPRSELLARAANELGLQMADSWMVGEMPDDIEAGHRAGCRTILLANGHETQPQPGRYRSPHYFVHGFDDAARVIAGSSQRPAHSLSVSDSSTGMMEMAQ